MCVSFHMFGVMCTMYLQVPTEARGASDSQDLGLQVSMSSLMWLLETEPRPFAGAVRTINH